MTTESFITLFERQKYTKYYCDDFLFLKIISLSLRFDLKDL